MNYEITESWSKEKLELWALKPNRWVTGNNLNEGSSSSNDKIINILRQSIRVRLTEDHSGEGRSMTLHMRSAWLAILREDVRWAR